MSEEEKLRIVLKTVHVDKPIVEAIYEAFCEYQTKWREKPEGVILGPNAWTAFKEYARENWHRVMDRDGRPNFNGVPVYRMRRQGVDLMPSDGVATYMTMGRVEEHRG